MFRSFVFLQQPSELTTSAPFSTPPMSPSRYEEATTTATNTNPFLEIDDPRERYNINDIPLRTLPNTTVTIHHLPNESDHFDAVGFHDTSLTNINFVPTSENTTIVNIHPAPRVRTTPFVYQNPPVVHRNPTFSTFHPDESISPLDDTTLTEI